MNFPRSVVAADRGNLFAFFFFDSETLSDVKKEECTFHITLDKESFNEL